MERATLQLFEQEENLPRQSSYLRAGDAGQRTFNQRPQGGAVRCQNPGGRKGAQVAPRRYEQEGAGGLEEANNPSVWPVQTLAPDAGDRPHVSRVDGGLDAGS